MLNLLEQLRSLSSAEDFLAFFGVPYDESVVRVNRLHILKRFHQYLQASDGLDALDEVTMFRRYRELLQRAHDDFVHSTAAREKVFEVFQRAEGRQAVSLRDLQASLAERRRPAAQWSAGDPRPAGEPRSAVPAVPAVPVASVQVMVPAPMPVAPIQPALS